MDISAPRTTVTLPDGIVLWIRQKLQRDKRALLDLNFSGSIEAIHSDSLDIIDEVLCRRTVGGKI